MGVSGGSVLGGLAIRIEVPVPPFPVFCFHPGCRTSKVGPSWDSELSIGVSIVVSSVLLKYNNLANTLLTSGHTQTPIRPVPPATWWKHKLPVGPSAGATFMRVLGMFPVKSLVVRATVPGVKMTQVHYRR